MRWRKPAAVVVRDLRERGVLVGRRSSARVACGPRTTISPISPARQRRGVASSGAIGASVIAMTATSASGTGRPTQTPGALGGAGRGLAEHLAALDRGHRQALGRAVGGDAPARRRRASRASGAARGRAPARRRAITRRRRRAAARPRARPSARALFEQRGRAEHVGHAEVLDCLDDLPRVRPSPGASDPCRGSTVVIPSAGSKSAKSGKVGRSISPGLDVVHAPDRLDLRGEVAVRVDGALGRAGAAAGEEDGGEVVGARSASSASPPSAPARSTSSRVSPPHGPSRPTVITVRTLPRAQRSTSRATCAAGMPMNTSGRASLEARLHVGEADPRVDHHRHRARLEEPEDQREELERGPHHQRDPRARAHPDRVQAARDPRRRLVELPVGQVRVADPPARVAPVREEDRGREGLPRAPSPAGGRRCSPRPRPPPPAPPPRARRRLSTSPPPARRRRPGE